MGERLGGEGHNHKEGQREAERPRERERERERGGEGEGAKVSDVARDFARPMSLVQLSTRN